MNSFPFPAKHVNAINNYPWYNEPITISGAGTVVDASNASNTNASVVFADSCDLRILDSAEFKSSSSGGAVRPRWRRSMRPVYQWAAEAFAAPAMSTQEAYTHGTAKSYLRIEPVGTTYSVTLNDEEPNTYTAGKEVEIAAEPYTAEQHFVRWEVEGAEAEAPTCTEAGWEAYESCGCGYSCYR